jgi:hypothetical protein
MKLVRIFDTEKDAINAKDILKDGGIKSFVQEDKFDGVPIQVFNVPARYRLMVEDEDYSRTVDFIASKLKNRIKD